MYDITFLFSQHQEARLKQVNPDLYVEFNFQKNCPFIFQYFQNLRRKILFEIILALAKPTCAVRDKLSIQGLGHDVLTLLPNISF